MHEISIIIIILIYLKLGSAGPIQQKNKLPLPKRKNVVFSVIISFPKNGIVFYWKQHNMLYFPKFLYTFWNSYSDVLHDFQQVVFHKQTIFVSHDVWKFIIIQKFNKHHHRDL